MIQPAMLSYRSLEERIPANCPQSKLWALVDGILVTMHATFEHLYFGTRLVSLPPVLSSVRSERQGVKRIEYHRLYRRSVGLSLDDEVWAATTFTEIRERLFTEAIVGESFGRVLAPPHWLKLTSNAHTTIDGTLIHA